MGEEAHRKMVEEISEVSYEVLTEWECGFIESIEEWLDDGRELSEKQIATLERIYDKVCRSSR